MPRGRQRKKTVHEEGLARRRIAFPESQPSLIFLTRPRAWGDERRDNALQGLSSQMNEGGTRKARGDRKQLHLSSGAEGPCLPQSHTPPHSVASLPSADPYSHGLQRSVPFCKFTKGRSGIQRRFKEKNETIPGKFILYHKTATAN